MMHEHLGEDFSNKKFYKHDFSRQKLQYAKFRGSTLIECKFVDTDLKYANFISANCYGSDFTGANLYRANMTECSLQHTIFKPRDCFGLTLTWKCETFRDMEVDETWLKVWMFMPTMMKLPPVKNGDKSWLDRLILLLGEKTYRKFAQVFENRII